MTWDAPTALDAAGHLLGYVVAARPGEGATGSHAPCRHHGAVRRGVPSESLSRAATMTGSGTPCIHSSTGLWISRPMWLTKVIPLDNTGRRNDKGTPWATARATWSAWTSPRASTTPRPRGCAGSGARSAHSTPTIRLPCRCTRPRSTSRIRWPPRTRRFLELAQHRRERTPAM
jgi:hypothetical protein